MGCFAFGIQTILVGIAKWTPLKITPPEKPIKSDNTGYLESIKRYLKQCRDFRGRAFKTSTFSFPFDSEET